MNPTEIRDRIRERIAPAILEYGFRGRSSTFSRDVGDVSHLIQIQASSANSTDGSRFTVNVAVWVRALSAEPRATVVGAHWNRRLGDLGPERTDLWWQANDLAMADEAASDMSKRVRLFAIPALDQLTSSSDLLALWRSGKSPGLTAVQADRFRRQLEKLGEA